MRKLIRTGAKKLPFARADERTSTEMSYDVETRIWKKNKIKKKKNRKIRLVIPRWIEQLIQLAHRRVHKT